MGIMAHAAPSSLLPVGMQGVKIKETVPEVGGIFSLPDFQQVSVMTEKTQFKVFSSGLSICSDV
jgi:hypothetical protein